MVTELKSKWDGKSQEELMNDPAWLRERLRDVRMKTTAMQSYKQKLYDIMTAFIADVEASTGKHVTYVVVRGRRTKGLMPIIIDIRVSSPRGEAEPETPEAEPETPEAKLETTPEAEPETPEAELETTPEAEAEPDRYIRRGRR